VRPSARLLAKGAVTAFGLAVSANTVFVSGRSVVYAFNKHKHGWSGTIKPSARLRATGDVTLVGTAVLVGNDIFAKPAHRWSGNMNPSATITAPFPPTDQTSEPGTLITTSVDTPASGCVTGCPAQLAAVVKPARGWVGQLHRTTIVKTTTSTGILPVALSGPNLFLTGGANIRVYRLGTTN
jgi:hypothetical protein